MPVLRAAYMHCGQARRCDTPATSWKLSPGPGGKLPGALLILRVAFWAAMLLL